MFLYHISRATLNIALGYETWDHLTIVLELSQLYPLPNLV